MKDNKLLLYGLGLLLVVMVYFAYANSFHSPFHFDDEHTIVTNSFIRDIHNIPLFFKDATTFSSLPANQAWRPGVTTLDAIDCWIGGVGIPMPYAYHVHIFIDYLILGFFIYLFVLKIYDIALKNPLNPYIALLTTAVYMLHTGNAETINYIISRSDSESTLMILISLCVFTYYKQYRKSQLYLIPMFIGFMIKEPSVMIAPLAFLFVFFFEENMSLKQVFDFKKDLKILMLVLPALALALFLFVYSQSQTPKSWTSGGTDRVSYMITELFVMVHYVDNFFFPFNLSADTDWGLVNSIFDDRAIMGFCFIVFTLYLAYKASINPQSRPIAYGILWFYLALVPTSSVVPFSEVLNDHRVFFPYIGLAMAVVWALFLVYKKYEVTITKSSWMRTAILVFIGVFLCAHVYGVRQRCHIWSSDDLLWKDVTEKSPRNGRGLMNYGLVLMGRGDYPGALEYYNKAKQEWPYYSYIYVNLGVLYSATHDPVESEKNFKYALQLNPNNPNCYFYYAIMLKDNKRIAEAKEQVAKGLALSPHHPDLVNFLTDLNTNPAYVASEQERAALMKKKLDDMAAAAKQANTPEAYLNLSLEYYNNGQYLECAHAAEESVRLKPDYDLAYNNICTAYNMLKDWDKAIAAGQKAIVINPNNIQAKNNLQVSLDGKKAAGK